jgi:5-methylcytosine-specific restriction protein A
MNPQVRQEVIERAQGRCELCNGPLQPMSVHHRRPRGMGGTRRDWVNEAGNLLAVCGTGTTGCHGMIESRRADAYDRGWLVRTGMDPTEVPFVDFDGNWWLLPAKTRITFPFDPPFTPIVLGG